MILMIKDFPDELRWKLRLRAFETGVTFREVVIGVLRGWCDGHGEIGGAERAAGVRGMRESVQDGAGARSGRRRAGVKRDAAGGGALDRASAGAGAVDGGVRADQGKDAEAAEGDDIQW